MSEWKEDNLENLIDEIIDHRGKTPKKLGGDWVSDGGFRAVSAKTIKNGRLVNESQMNRLPEGLYIKWMKTEVESGDIFLTSEAPLGEHILWKSPEKVVLSQRIFGIRTNPSKLNSTFFNYYIDSPRYQHELKSRESGTTVTGIKQSELLKTKVRFPSDIGEQESIAAVLSSLDDKIELLKEQNKTLEDMAQLLFKRWFVDFNFPDKNGKPYKDSGGKMIDSELGPIPDGWNVGKIGDIASLNQRQISQRDNIDSILYLDTGSLTEGIVDNLKVFTIDEAPSRAKRKVQHNSILYSVVRPAQRHYGLIKYPQEKYIVSTGFCVIDSASAPHYIYLTLIQNSVVEYFESIASSSASTYPTMRPENIGEFRIVLPPEKKLNCFEFAVEKTFDKVYINLEQVQYLAQFRDNLQSKLMTGEIRL